MTSRQLQTLEKIKKLSIDLGVNTAWALAIADQESSLGEHQLSPTGAKGVYQMTKIAMLDLVAEMVKKDDDLIDICCGLLFMRLLYKRHGSFEEAMEKYCDPKDRYFYVPGVMKKKEKWERYLGQKVTKTVTFWDKVKSVLVG